MIYKYSIQYLIYSINFIIIIKKIENIVMRLNLEKFFMKTYLTLPSKAHLLLIILTNDLEWDYNSIQN